MKLSLLASARSTAALILAAVIAVDPALASNPVPGPLLGAGAPALAVFAAGYYLIRKRRNG